MDYASFPQRLRYGHEENEYVPSSQVRGVPAPIVAAPQAHTQPQAVARRRPFAQHGLPPTVEDGLERILDISGARVRVL